MGVCGLGPAKPANVVEKNNIAGNWLGQTAHSWLKEQDICLKILTCTSIYLSRTEEHGSCCTL